MKKEELIEKVKNIEITYDYEGTYCDLRNAVIDYENETQDWSLDYLFDDFIDYELVEERAKWELENGGLERLQCFLGDCSTYGRDLFKLNGYGNLENISSDDLECLKEDILKELEDK